MPYQKLVFVRLLFQRIDRTGAHTVGLLAFAAHEVVGCKFHNRDDTVVVRVIKVAALYDAFLALSSGADVEVDEQAHFISLSRFDIKLTLM
jgi:hypothetical protein